MNFKKVVDSLDGLPDDAKKLYTEKDGKFHLDAAAAVDYLASQLEDQTGMKRNYDRLNDDTKKLHAKVKEYEDAKIAAEDAARKAAEEKTLDAQKKANDFDGYKQSVEKKHLAEIEARELKINELTQYIDKLTVDATALTIASELAVQDSAPLLIPLVKSRLRTKYSEGMASVEILDEMGRPTAFTVDDLKKQIASNPSCARIIKGSDASGAGHQSSASATNVSPQGGAQGKRDGTKEEQAAYWQAKIGELKK